MLKVYLGKYLVMARKKTGKGSRFSEDAPWRAYKGEKPVPRINKGGVVPVRQGPNFQYAISIMKVWPVICTVFSTVDCSLFEIEGFFFEGISRDNCRRIEFSV